MIKMLQVEYGLKAPSMLRYCKHARIETSTTWGGFYCSLSKKLINLLLNNRMMSCSCLDIKAPEVTEKGRMGSKLKMVTPNHIKHKPVGYNASPLIKKNWKAYQPEKLQMEMMRRLKRLRTLAHQEHWPPCPLFFSTQQNWWRHCHQQTSCHLDKPQSHSPSEAS